MDHEEYTSMQILLAITGLSPVELDAIKKQEGDFYTNVLVKALSIEAPKVTAFMRNTAKSILFSYVYRMRNSDIERALRQPRRSREDENG